MINRFNRWFFVVCAQIVVGLSAVDLNDTPEDVLNYIDSVQKKLNVAQNSNIILVVGNTGCGKSTLVHYVAGDYSRIIAIEPLNPNSVNFDIRDELDSERDRPILATESRTLIPVISTDENHNVWMDCPGFGDTRNETVEIATAFLIKRVIENASHIKIVLVSSYDSIINSRDDFDNLLTRSAQLMNNVTRFENSISLVVTKAPPFKIRGRRYIDIFDDNIKNTTANFMIDHHSVLKTKRAAHNKMQLIESLLGRNTPTNEYYPKISVFWRPNDAGPFNKIEKMIAGRRSIRESIINHSSYTPVRMTDFGLPLTPQAQIKVRNLRQHTVNSIKAILQHNIDRLIVKIQSLIQSASTVKIRLEIINVGQSFFQTNIHGSKEITLDQLADKLGWLIREYNVSTTDVEGLHRISRYGENLLIFSSLIATDGDASDNLINLDYYSYLQQVNEFLITKDNDIRNGIVKKTQEMKLQISKILVNSDEQLLQALHKKIELTNGFQNRLQILEAGKRSIPPNGEVRTVKERIDQLKKLTYAFEIPSINVTALNYVNRYEKSLTELKSLVDEEFRLPIRDWIGASSKAIDYQLLMYDWYSFLEETYRYFSDPVVAHRDRYVSINETNFGTITKRIRRNAIFEATPGRIIEINKIRNITMKTPATYECEGETLTIKGRLIRTSAIQNALVTKCDTPQDLTMVKVFVLDTLYVDSDLYLNQPKEMELQIMAPKWNIQKHAKFYLNGLDAENYNQSANEGSGGMHGEPGSNGGNFFGWANIVTNSEWLSVDLSGGRGANGQNGAGSRDGVVELNETGFSDSGFTFGSKPPIDHIRSYFIRNRYNPQAISEAGGGITSFNGYSIGLNVTHTFALQPECCGRTGAGGIGGFGGAGGSGHFICSSGKIDNIPNIISKSGNNGGTGRDGKQCKNLELIVSVATEIDNNLVRRNMRSKFYNKHHRHFKGCPLHSMKFYPGKPNPTRKRLRESINFVPSLIEYNLYLLRNINDPDDNVAQSTYEIINSDPAINSAYTINDLATEANTLERNYSELSKYIDVLPLYDNMLKKIERFAVNNEGKLSRDDQNVLSLIYTMISSKTTGMRSSHTSDLIVNIKSFLDLTAQNVKKLNELKRMDVITVQRDEYKNELSAKIQEAKNFIENDINPEIRRTISLLNDELQKAVDDTIELRSRILYEINAKEEQLRILRRNVNARNILSIFELIGGITEVICESIPSKIFGGMMKFVSQISKTDFVVDPKISNKHDVPQSIQRLRNTMHTMGQEKIESTENELQILKKSLQENNVTNHTFTDHLDKFIFNANSIKMSSSSLVMHDVNGFLKICIKFLRGWQDAFESERKASIQRPIQRALYALTVVATSFPTYKRIYSDDDKITEVIQALNQDSETLEVLRKFEEGIYSDLMLMVDEMYEYVTNVGENLFKKSSVALDVTSWNVQRTIRNVQNKLIDKISQFDIESNTNECMIRINKAMELLIDIYDRIQSYERESKLITYLSNLHITSYSDIHDSKSKEMLNEMEENLQMNSVLGQYFRVFGAFKQVIFPYASDYLSAFEIPSSLIVSNTSTSTALVSQQIETLSEKLKEYNDTVINEHDKRIHPTTFGRDQGSTGPFYTWSNFEIRDRIQQLFTEKRIYLLADVHKSDTRNAVKFNKIELGFHINNLTLNHQLQEVLQSFHVSLTHMGNSNYRCNNTFYTIPSQPVDIKYSIGKRNGKPVDRNLVYDKLAASPSLLSPYTLWSVQLSRGQFNKLQRFVDFIDIELYGEGLYLEEDAPICKTNLEKYYSVMSQIF